MVVVRVVVYLLKAEIRETEDQSSMRHKSRYEYKQGNTRHTVNNGYQELGDMGKVVSTYDKIR